MLQPDLAVRDRFRDGVQCPRAVRVEGGVGPNEYHRLQDAHIKIIRSWHGSMYRTCRTDYALLNADWSERLRSEPFAEA